MMRIVFMGSPLFAANILEELSFQHEIVAVISTPDAVRGRGNNLVPTPVKEKALELALPVYCPSSLRNSDIYELLVSLVPDVICVVAYGKLLPKEILEIPQYGCLNVHASLLPRWRGAAPIERALLAGDTEIGVCIMRMEEGLDTGPYCVRRAIDVANRTGVELRGCLSSLGTQALLTALSQVANDTVSWIYQNDNEATYAQKLSSNELYILDDDDVCLALRKIIASDDAHPCKVKIGEKSVTLLEAHRIDRPADLSLQTANLFQKQLSLAFENGLLVVDKVKPDGKQCMPGKDFANGVPGLKSGLVCWSSLV